MTYLWFISVLKRVMLAISKRLAKFLPCAEIERKPCLWCVFKKCELPRCASHSKNDEVLKQIAIEQVLVFLLHFYSSSYDRHLSLPLGASKEDLFMHPLNILLLAALPPINCLVRA